MSPIQRRAGVDGLAAAQGTCCIEEYVCVEGDAVGSERPSRCWRCRNRFWRGGTLDTGIEHTSEKEGQ